MHEGGTLVALISYDARFLLRICPVSSRPSEYFVTIDNQRGEEGIACLLYGY